MKLRFFASFAAALLLLPATATAQGVSASDEVDESIERGLAYLAAVQNEDGSFPFSRGKHGAISALAGMAFLAKGYTPGSDRYGDQINRCTVHRRLLRRIPRQGRTKQHKDVHTIELHALPLRGVGHGRR